MRPDVALRLALAGNRTDTARVVLTALSAALASLAGLAALTVLAIPTPPGGRGGNNSEQYTNALLREPGLRGGTAVALLLLAVPVLALAGQCVRLGAPARDRRLAGFRLAGATPGQVTGLVAVEAGLASLLGTLVGLVAYLVGRVLLHRPDARGLLPLPTDVLPSPLAIGAVVLGLPVLAGLVGVVLLRRVTATPFGVVRRMRRERAPGSWAGLLILAGLAAYSLLVPIGQWYADRGQHPPALLRPALTLGGGLAALVGVVAGTGWLSYMAGRLLHRHGRGPAALLASRRLTADPWAGSRTLAALLAAVIVGAGAAEVRSSMTADMAANRAGGQSFAADDDFYLNTMDLVDRAVYLAIALAAGGLIVALVEGIVARRRTYAALVASGVPRGVIGRSVAWQALAPAVPAIALALAAGLLLTWGVAGRQRTYEGHSLQVCTGDRVRCADPAALRTVWVPETVVTPELPWAQLAWVGAGALAAVLVTVGVGLLFLRMSTAVEELRAG
ncbi:FtsX-like permease family protein [Micromonospora sp. HM134]|uniref:FtsX-like permease family protein n=1 Tax=Micromonospora sp. HM134 TaxID=2583243 RepID=UPI001198B3F0|nr:FtsX-like permease family protein [Micromonospora sp. HM134]QDY05997.1 FtsX-like permease family protein [Micromonospora sp. HM134]